MMPIAGGLTRMVSNESPSSPTWHGTTVLTVRKGGTVVIGGDGQVSIGQTIVKSNAKKVRQLGTGDVLEPEAGVAGIGSGGNYALAAARALIDGPLDAEQIVRKSLDIAADICVYTNRNVTIESLKS